MKESFDVLNNINELEIKEIVNRLGDEKLTSTGHGYMDVGAISIIDASNQSTKNYTKDSVEKPAMALLSVVLAANRNYNKVVEPNLIKIIKGYPNLKTLNQLSEIIESKTEQEFFEFWGHKDRKKYSTLQRLLSTINKDLRELYPKSINDFELMKNWGDNVDLINYEEDIIGRIPNIGVATIQHLRMVYGVDTVKPDQRVKEVLDYEFGLSRLSDKKVIKAIEQIARIVQKDVITIDQIFVKYGSSHYNRNLNKLTVKQIAKNLKDYKVEIDIISKATFLSKKQIERL
jgi:hypothetical protein